MGPVCTVFTPVLLFGGGDLLLGPSVLECCLKVRSGRLWVQLTRCPEWAHDAQQEPPGDSAKRETWTVGL